MSIREQNTRSKILLGEDNNALTWLLIINSIIFIALNFIKVVYLIGNDDNSHALKAFHEQIVTWFSLPANGESLLSRPWTIVSFMFSHESIWYLISSLLWLWCFGYILQDIAGNSKLFPIYLYGGFAGALAFLLAANFIPSAQPQLSWLSTMGAGASVMAVAVATTTIAPNYRIFPLINGGIPLWIVLLVFAAIDFTTIAATSESIACSHLAGALMGFVFIKQLKKGNDWSEWMHRSAMWVNDLFNPEKKQPKHEKERFFYKANRKPFERIPHVTQQKVDELLDKINQQGYHFLSEEEKDFLKKASKDL